MFVSSSVSNLVTTSCSTSYSKKRESFSIKWQSSYRNVSVIKTEIKKWGLVTYVFLPARKITHYDELQVAYWFHFVDVLGLPLDRIIVLLLRLGRNLPPCAVFRSEPLRNRILAFWPSQGSVLTDFKIFSFWLIPSVKMDNRIQGILSSKLHF